MSEPSVEEISQRLAQVYCEKEHSHKELDANLIISMTAAIRKLLDDRD